ncbi:hypothetical protein V6N12_054756 [Hibiscus sabdariffa]|uniref:Cytochrome P450 n=1 Tax=Hibiscus sabdariffa TaxID=183260 RepID=A0ABR2D1E0_9ROSI
MGMEDFELGMVDPKGARTVLETTGLRGNPYRSLSGDMKQMFGMNRQTRTRPMPLSDDIEPYVTPFFHQFLIKYGTFYINLQFHGIGNFFLCSKSVDLLRGNAGKDSFLWIGPRPRVTVMEPDKIREIFTKFADFQKMHNNPLVKLIVSGIAGLEGDRWSRHRKIINPAFHQDKLKYVLVGSPESRRL